MTTNSELCMLLMRADTEAEVVQILKDAAYWDDPTAWRLLGDAENNFSSIGNQQSEAVAALIEKLINSVDARLMNACAEQQIDPMSPEAPTSIREAVAKFFEGKSTPDTEVDGRISRWPSAKTTEEGRLLTLSATGHMPSEGRPSLTIADKGEGQAPDDWPDTFLSLQKSNKLRIHFVQGKFNMGGTGALQFCSGKHKLQLIVSRRNPALVATGAAPRASEWGFTIVRREAPKAGVRSSVYTYLAPVPVTGSPKRGVLSFPSSTWPIFPESDAKERDAYARHSEYGSLVKLYEYEWLGNKSNIVSSGQGLLRRIDSGLPELALPIRLFECRPGYSGHGASFSTNVTGLASRLERDKADKLEEGFPVGGIINLDGSPVRIRIYAFKPGEARGYRTAKQGVIFALSGQSHASFATEFFRRKSVGMSYLADSLFVLADCSGIEGQTREDLFMNSRDRLRDTPLARQLESELEYLVKDEPKLKALRNSRREAELSEKLEDSKPLSNILQDLLKKSPALSKLLLHGLNLPSPFPPGGGAGKGKASQFHGKVYPTYFRFRGMNDAEHLTRDAHLDSRTRIALETDAEDAYFVRDLDAAGCRLLIGDNTSGWEEVVAGWQVRGPRSGLAHLTIADLPEDVAVGESVSYRFEVTDPQRIYPFVNEVTLRVLPPVEHSSGGSGGKGGSKNSGNGDAGGGSSLALPNITEVVEDDWAKFDMNEHSALHVKHAGEDEEGGPQVYDFFVNVDNKFLRTAEKESKGDPKLLQAQFKYGLVLVGLALLQEDVAPAAKPSGDEEAEPAFDVERLVRHTTASIAPILLPMIESLSALSIDEDE